MMRKYKLIKCYPGSPELGAVVEGEETSGFYYYEKPDLCRIVIQKKLVDNQSEYWEKVVDFYYMVSMTDMPFYNAWEPIRVRALELDTDTKKYFSTKEGARDFIIQYKPCLSFNEVRGLVGHDFFGSTSHQKLFELVKSRIRKNTKIDTEIFTPSPKMRTTTFFGKVTSSGVVLVCRTITQGHMLST